MPDAEQALNPGASVAVSLRVSVVIPCRNEAPYIEGLLDAIKAQDLLADDVVVVDGGSTDETIAVIRRYAKRHPAFRLCVIAAHGASIAAALNTGVSATESELIVRMDAHSGPAADYIQQGRSRRCTKQKPQSWAGYGRSLAGAPGRSRKPSREPLRIRGSAT